MNDIFKKGHKYDVVCRDVKNCIDYTSCRTCEQAASLKKSSKRGVIMKHKVGHGSLYVLAIMWSALIIIRIMWTKSLESFVGQKTALMQMDDSYLAFAVNQNSSTAVTAAFIAITVALIIISIPILRRKL